MGGSLWGGLSWIHRASAEAVRGKTGAGPVHNETSRTLVWKGEEKCAVKDVATEHSAFFPWSLSQHVMMFSICFVMMGSLELGDTCQALWNLVGSWGPSLPCSLAHAAHQLPALEQMPCALASGEVVKPRLSPSPGPATPTCSGPETCKAVPPPYQVCSVPGLGVDESSPHPVTCYTCHGCQLRLRWLLPSCFLKHHSNPSLSVHPGPHLEQRRWQSLRDSQQRSQELGKWAAVRTCPAEEGLCRSSETPLMPYCPGSSHLQNIDSKVKLWGISWLWPQSTEPQAHTLWAQVFVWLCWPHIMALCRKRSFWRLTHQCWLSAGEPRPSWDRQREDWFFSVWASSCGSAFLVAWWLDSKNKCPRRARQKLCCILALKITQSL